ncbi:MAG: hypothetical protein RQ751_04825, partial [Longimicrobiales bacterium]|nr:hypothetical protein [Longimicrobiales bacterium]
GGAGEGYGGTGADAGPDLRLARALAFRAGVEAVTRAPARLADGHGPLLLHLLLAGVLGAEPDARSGRLGLSPFLPPHWTRFRVAGIRVGDAVLALEFERSGGHVCWTLRPEAGSVPVMVVFRPWQPLAHVRAIRVDGREAALDVTGAALAAPPEGPGGGWSRVSVQLPVDAPRVLEVEGDAPPPSTDRPPPPRL